MCWKGQYIRCKSCVKSDAITVSANGEENVDCGFHKNEIESQTFLQLLKSWWKDNEFDENRYKELNKIIFDQLSTKQVPNSLKHVSIRFFNF